MKEVGLPTCVHPSHCHTVDTDKWSYDGIDSRLVEFVFGTAKEGTLSAFQDPDFQVRRGIAIIPTLARDELGRQIKRGTFDYCVRQIARDYVPPSDTSRRDNGRSNRSRRDDESYSSSGSGERESRHRRGGSNRSERRGNNRHGNRPSRNEDNDDDNDVANDEEGSQSSSRSSDYDRRGGNDAARGGGRRKGSRELGRGQSNSTSRRGDDDGGDEPAKRGRNGDDGNAAENDLDQLSEAHREKYKRQQEMRQKQAKETWVRRYVSTYQSCMRKGLEPVAQLSEPSKEDIPTIRDCIGKMEAELAKRQFVDNHIDNVRTTAGLIVGINRTLGDILPLDDVNDPEGGFLSMAYDAAEDCRGELDDLFDMQLQQKGSIRAVQGHPLQSMATKFLKRCAKHGLNAKYGFDVDNPGKAFSAKGASEDDVYRTHVADQQQQQSHSPMAEATPPTTSAPRQHSSTRSESSNAEAAPSNSKHAIANRRKQSSSTAPPPSQQDDDESELDDQMASPSLPSNPSSSSKQKTAATTSAPKPKRSNVNKSNVRFGEDGKPIDETHSIMEKQASQVAVMKSVSAFSAL